MKSKIALDSGFDAWIPDFRKWIPVFISGILDSGFQSIVGFRILQTKIPEFWNLDSLTKGEGLGVQIV